MKQVSTNVCYDASMISYIRGTIAGIGDRSVIMEANNIGYKISVTDDTLHAVEMGKETVFWTHFAVREDAQDLYGFPDKRERDFFELLITVSGIGPKTALNILSLISSDALISAIRNESTAHLVKMSGIGRKTAEKIILELKDKLGGFAKNAETDSGMANTADALEALKALGYNTDEAREALKKIDRDIADTGMKVKAALKVLGR